MIVINFFGGPGAGKSTIALDITTYLKQQGLRAEFTGEEAKSHIFNGALCQLENQVQISCGQYKRLKDLERAGCRIAVSDSPLVMNVVYGKHLHYYQELRTLVRKLNSEFDNVNIWIDRSVPYETFGRVQKTPEEAIHMAYKVYNEVQEDIQKHFSTTDQKAIRTCVMNALGERK